MLNLALLAQGLVRTTANGEGQGSYGVIEQMLNNQNVIASKAHRDLLSADLKLLIPDSMSEQTPIILSTIGNPVTTTNSQIQALLPEGFSQEVQEIIVTMVLEFYTENSDSRKQVEGLR